MTDLQLIPRFGNKRKCRLLPVFLQKTIRQPVLDIGCNQHKDSLGHIHPCLLFSSSNGRYSLISVLGNNGTISRGHHMPMETANTHCIQLLPSHKHAGKGTCFAMRQFSIPALPLSSCLAVSTWFHLSGPSLSSL